MKSIAVSTERSSPDLAAEATQGFCFLRNLSILPIEKHVWPQCCKKGDISDSSQTWSVVSQCVCYCLGAHIVMDKVCQKQLRRTIKIPTGPGGKNPAVGPGSEGENWERNHWYSGSTVDVVKECPLETSYIWNFDSFLQLVQGQLYIINIMSAGAYVECD